MKHVSELSGFNNWGSQLWTFANINWYALLSKLKSWSSGRFGEHREPLGVADSQEVTLTPYQYPRPREVLRGVHDPVNVPHSDRFIHWHFQSVGWWWHPRHLFLHSPQVEGQSDSGFLRHRRSHLSTQWLLSSFNDRTMPSFFTTPDQQTGAGFSVSHWEAQPLSARDVLQV